MELIVEINLRAVLLARLMNYNCCCLDGNEAFLFISSRLGSVRRARYWNTSINYWRQIWRAKRKLRIYEWWGTAYKLLCGKTRKRWPASKNRPLFITCDISCRIQHGSVCFVFVAILASCPGQPRRAPARGLLPPVLFKHRCCIYNASSMKLTTLLYRILHKLGPFAVNEICLKLLFKPWEWSVLIKW